MEWLLSRMAEEFGGKLVDGGAVDQPFELALRIMDLRGYARLKAAVEQAEAHKLPLPAGWELVWQIRAMLHGGTTTTPGLSEQEARQQRIEQELFG